VEPVTPGASAGTGANARADRAKRTAGAGEGGTTTAAGELDAKAARAEATEALKRVAKPAETDSPASVATAKAVREVLEERIRWLDEWEKVKEAQARHVSEPSPERQAAGLKAELERVKALLGQAARDPDVLVPGAFRTPAGPVSDATRAEMKEALDAAKTDFNECNANLEKLRASAAQSTNTLSTLRAERDKIHQRVAALKARNDEREAAIAAAKTPDEAILARERLVNLRWESRVETERLQIQEALIASESARPDLTALHLQVLDAHAQLAARTLERMQQRYGLVTELQERKLKQAAASEQKRAARSDDPLEKYRARRTAELLELQAQVLKLENPAASGSYPVLEEQRELADLADADLAAIKALLDDGKVSRLDALRLNNNFRRIGPERGRIVSHELAAAMRLSTLLENLLSSVEIDLIDSARNDRLQNEDLLQRLAGSRHPEARALFEELDPRYHRLLERKRLALEKLAQRAELTQQQIERRVAKLDEEYGFIRTHIFWVRDQEPIGAVTVAQCQAEVAILGRSLLPLVQEACDRSLWGRVSLEFAVAAMALLALPWPLYRLGTSLCPGRPQAP
jgi:potassium efflux system protein